MSFLQLHPRFAAIAAWAIFVASAAFAIAGLVFIHLGGESLDKWSVGSAIMGIAMPAVGAQIASRRPDNIIGWLLCVIGFTQGFDAFTTAYGTYALVTHPGTLPGGGEAAWLSNWDFAPGITLLLIFLPLLFPDGRLLSPRWRIVLWLGVVEMLLFTVPVAIVTWGDRGPALLGDDTPSETTADLIAAGLQLFALILSFLLAVAAVVSVVKRYRRADGQERLQLKWFLFAVAVQIAVAIPLTLLPRTSSLGIALALIWSPIIPIGIGIAVLRHRLYGIDLIINRTLVYVPLTGILAGLYVVMTSVFKTVFTDLTESGSELSVAMSTLAIVAVLTPLKNHLQSLVDRKFKQQHDPMAAVCRLTAQARGVAEVLDTERFVSTLLGELTTALGAQGARVAYADGRSTTAGEPGASLPVQVPLVRDEQSLGTLLLWPSSEAKLDEGSLPDELTQAADALAQVLSLDREQPARAAAPAVAR